MSMRSVSSLAALLLLTACEPPFATNWMPVGYTYQDDTPITSPAPSKPWLKDAVIKDTEALATNTAAWQGAVFELVDKISAKVPAASGPIALKALEPNTTQKQTLDHYLRQGLIQRGYTVATTSAAPGPVLTYDILNLSNPSVRDWTVKTLGADAIPGSNMKDMYVLRATTTSDGAILSDEAVVAVLPGEKTEYRRWPGFTNQPAQGKALHKTPVYVSRD
jgi:hypothetical protein